MWRQRHEAAFFAETSTASSYRMRCSTARMTPAQIAKLTMSDPEYDRIAVQFQ